MDNKTKKYLEYGIAGLIAGGAIYLALKAPLPPLIQTPQNSNQSTQPSAQQQSTTPPQQQSTAGQQPSSPQCSKLCIGFGSIPTLQQCFPGTTNNCGFPNDVINGGFCEYAWDDATYTVNKPSEPGFVVYNPYNKWFSVWAVNGNPGYYQIPTCNGCNIANVIPVAFDMFNVYPNGYSRMPNWAIPNMISYGNIFFYTQSGAYVDIITSSSELQYIYNNNIQVIKTVIDPTIKGFEIGVVNVPANGCLSITQPSLSNSGTVFQVQSGIDFPLWFDDNTEIQFCYNCKPTNCTTLTPMPV